MSCSAKTRFFNSNSKQFHFVFCLVEFYLSTPAIKPHVKHRSCTNTISSPSHNMTHSYTSLCQTVHLLQLFYLKSNTFSTELLIHDIYVIHVTILTKVHKFLLYFDVTVIVAIYFNSYFCAVTVSGLRFLEPTSSQHRSHHGLILKFPVT